MPPLSLDIPDAAWRCGAQINRIMNTATFIATAAVHKGTRSWWLPCCINVDLLALFGIVFTGISAIEELSIEQLNSDHSKDELKEDVDDEDVEHVLERDDHTVENSLQLGYPVDCLQWSQHS